MQLSGAQGPGVGQATQWDSENSENIRYRMIRGKKTLCKGTETAALIIFTAVHDLNNSIKYFNPTSYELCKIVMCTNYNNKKRRQTIVFLKCFHSVDSEKSSLIPYNLWLRRDFFSQLKSVDINFFFLSCRYFARTRKSIVSYICIENSILFSSWRKREAKFVRLETWTQCKTFM